MKIKKEKRFFLNIIILSILLFFFSFNLIQAQTASLFLSPASGSHQVGTTFSIRVSVKSEQSPINAAEANISFNPNLIRVRSISKDNSIFIFWPVEPTFSNGAGTIKFTGGTTGQYRGSNGNIITIVFEAIAEGSASISFTGGRVLAADGLGTEVTGNFTGGNYTITRSTGVDPEIPGPIDPSSPLEIPSEPKIFSGTHPDPEKWYNNNSPKFSWDISQEIDGVRIAIADSENVRPNIVHDPLVSFREFENIEDGIWYFSVQLKNQLGWGKIGRFKFQIDTINPEPFILEIDNQGDLTNPTPIFIFETNDELSGISHYELILNDLSYQIVKPEDIVSGSYTPLPLSPGRYSLTVKAFDRAGNFSSTSAEFAISGIFFEIDKIPTEIRSGQSLIITGRALPGSIIRIYFQREGEDFFIREAVSDSQGLFRLEEILEKGNYMVWAQAEDERGALSESTEKYSIEVVFDRLGFFLLILLIILIIVGIFAIWFLWKNIFEEKEKTKKEEVKKRVEIKQKAYSILKERIESQIEYLEGKVDLSRSESRLLEEFRRALKESEGARETEIKVDA